MKGKDSVHGDSAGVHASDAANAWRNIARVSNPRNAFASLIVAAYCLAPGVGNNSRVGKDLYPLPEHLEKVRGKDPAALLRQAERAIRANDQPLACAAVHRYGELGHSRGAIFDLLLQVCDQRGRRLARREVLPHRQRGVRRRPPRIPLAAAGGAGASDGQRIRPTGAGLRRGVPAPEGVTVVRFPMRNIIAKHRAESGREDLNLRPPGPKPGALARLRYAPMDGRERPIEFNPSGGGEK